MDLSQIFGGEVPQLPTLPTVGMDPSFPTGPINAQGPPSSSPSSPSIVPGLVGAGTNILGNFLKTYQNQAPDRASLAERQREFDQQQGNRTAEVQRRNSLFGMAAPGILGNLGYSQGAIPGMISNLNTASTPPAHASAPAPSGGGSNLSSTILGLLGPAVGILSKLHGVSGGGPGGTSTSGGWTGFMPEADNG